MKIKNFVLDMGNVLLDFNPDYSLECLCENKEAARIIKKEFFGSTEWVQTDMGTITPQERFERVNARIDEKYRPELKAVSDGWDICMTPLDGAKEFLSFIKENRFGLYLLSNASTEFYTYFPREIDIDMFDGTVISCDLHIIKPDVRIYEHLLKKYSLIPEECLFVDDRPENVDGAVKAGMKGFVFTGDYEEVKKLVEK